MSPCSTPAGERHIGLHNIFTALRVPTDDHESPENTDLGYQINSGKQVNSNFTSNGALLVLCTCYSLAAKALLSQFQGTPLPPTARAPVCSLQGKPQGDGEAGPEAGGQQHPGQSVCGPMGLSPLSLGETSLVSAVVGP